MRRMPAMVCLDFAGVEPGRHLIEQQQLGVRVPRAVAMVTRFWAATGSSLTRLAPRLVQSHIVEDPVGLGFGRSSGSGCA